MFSLFVLGVVIGATGLPGKVAEENFQDVNVVGYEGGFTSRRGEQSEGYGARCASADVRLFRSVEEFPGHTAGSGLGQKGALCARLKPRQVMGFSLAQGLTGAYY